ncbi:putative ribonuclease H-like domain-containing protein [Tanacetum coccineum]
MQSTRNFQSTRRVEYDRSDEEEHKYNCNYLSHSYWYIIHSMVTIGESTTEPASSSDRHLLSFHDAQDAQSLWAAIKARFGGNKESKKMQKNLLKLQVMSSLPRIQANRVNGSKEKRLCPFEIQTQNFGAKYSPRPSGGSWTRCTWSFFDWSEEADNARPLLLLLMAYKLNLILLTQRINISKKNKFYTMSKGNRVYCVKGNPEEELKDHAIIDSGCSGSMTGDKDKLSDFKEYKGGYVAFGNDPKGGRITGKGTIKTSCIDFEKCQLCEGIHINLLSVLSDLILRLLMKTLCFSELLRKKMKYQSESQQYIPILVSNMFRMQKHLKDEAILLAQKMGGTLVEKIRHMTYIMIDCGLENKLRRKVKTIRCDHETEFKNKLMNEFCAKKGIQREYSIARTLQQNGVAERKNRTLIEAARTSFLPFTSSNHFNTGLKAVHTAVLCSQQGNLKRTKIVFMMIFLSDQTKMGKNQKGKGPDWMFDLDILSPSLNYIPFRSSTIGNKAVIGRPLQMLLTTRLLLESTIVKEVPLTIEDQDLQKEFENLMLHEIIAHTHMKNQGIASEKRKEKGKEIYDLSDFPDDEFAKEGKFFKKYL